MKRIDPLEMENLPGRRLGPSDRFRFRCHPGLACFNRCCRNLNLFLYPYDVLRLRGRLGVSSDAFLDRYVDVVLRPGARFPEVLLTMAENAERTCPFLTSEGCGVYPDRPDTCRGFPVERGLLYDAAARVNRPVHFFRPPDFCLGRHEEDGWNLAGWEKDQEAGKYREMTVRWAEIRQLLEGNPWGGEGAEGPRAKMTFMAAYNTDRFRDFVFASSFLQRYSVKKKVQQRIRRNDTELLQFGFEWIRLFVFGIETPNIRLRR
jgi:Fe-S-cluster containining protein